jgi:hypothetical protein
LFVAVNSGSGPDAQLPALQPYWVGISAGAMPPRKKLTFLRGMNAFQGTTARVSSLKFFCWGPAREAKPGLVLKFFDRDG